jgi:radical SAM superfamily enzyme YgiQ (UPF0313 family)
MGNIVLVSPNVPGPYSSANIVAESLGLGLLSAVLTEHGYSNKIIDARMHNLSPEQATENIVSFDIVGLTLPLGESEAIPWAIQFVELCKKINPSIRFIAGGYLPTILPERVFDQIPDIDVIVLGEGEKTIIDILSAYKNGTNIDSISGIAYKRNGNIVKTCPRSLVTDLDSNPLPYRYAQDFVNEEFEVLVEGARGCMNNCTFCTVKPFFHNNQGIHWRGRSAESLVKEIKVISEIYPAAKRIRFVDPDFIGDNKYRKERIYELCHLLTVNQLLKYNFYIESRVLNITNDIIDLLQLMKKSGFVEVYLGLESGSDSTLRMMNKQSTVQDSINAINILKEVEIDIAYGFMMFTPWASMDDIKKNIAFLANIGDVQFDRLFHRLYMIPQTPSVKITESKGLLRGMNATGYYDYEFEHSDVAALASVRDYLRKYHLDFLVEIWYTYKDVKTWGQAFPSKARKLLEDISTLSLEIFADLCECREHIDVNFDNKNSHIDAIIKKRMPTVELLHNKTDMNYRFPRPKATEG